MKPLAFHPRFEDLPAEVPLFPLPEAFLLPWAQIPLNIFEPRYLNMIAGALQNKRMFGFIQSLEEENMVSVPQLSRIGCLARISSFHETEDGRLVIAATGVCRFRITEELQSTDGYRRARVDYSEFEMDLEPQDAITIPNRARLLELADAVVMKNFPPDERDILPRLSDAGMVAFIALVGPFDGADKQMLLECGNVRKQAEILQTLLEMAQHTPFEGQDYSQMN
jgi:Lon protease-like protein